MPLRVTPLQKPRARGAGHCLWVNGTSLGEQLHLMQGPGEALGPGGSLSPGTVPVSIPLALLPCSSQSPDGLLGWFFFFLCWGEITCLFSFYLPNAPDLCSVGQNLTLQIRFLFHSVALFLAPRETFLVTDLSEGVLPQHFYLLKSQTQLTHRGDMYQDKRGKAFLPLAMLCDRPCSGPPVTPDLPHHLG